MFQILPFLSQVFLEVRTAGITKYITKYMFNVNFKHIYFSYFKNRNHVYFCLKKIPFYINQIFYSLFIVFPFIFSLRIHFTNILFLRHFTFFFFFQTHLCILIFFILFLFFVFFNLFIFFSFFILFVLFSFCILFIFNILDIKVIYFTNIILFAMISFTSFLFFF